MTKYSLNYFVKAAGTLLFCLYCHSLHSEKHDLDSLKRSLEGASGTSSIVLNYQIGTNFFDTNSDSAILYYTKSLALAREQHNDSFEARSLNKIGNLYYESGDYDKAIPNIYSALKIFERIGDKWRAMRCLQYLGMAYNEQGMYDKALDYDHQSLEMALALKDKYSAGVSLTSIGAVYYAQSNYDKALEFFQKALHTMEEINDQRGISDALNNMALIYEKQGNSRKALELHLRSLETAKEMGDTRNIAASYHNIGLSYQGLKSYPTAIQYIDSAIALARDGEDRFYLREMYNSLAEVYSDMGNYEKAYKTHLLFSALNDTLLSEENKRQFAEMNTKYETEKKDKEIVLLNKDKELQKTIRNGFVGGFAVVLLFAGVFFSQRNRIKKGKKRSDELLLNILPSETAEELKLTGEAQARHFDAVTVMFTDFKNFTQASEKLSATELVKGIHHCYSEFDKIITKHRLEKIKTIGDSYMCAGGLPVANKSNAEDIIRAALEICDFMNREMQEGRSKGNPFFEIRIGCHTGPVVAGIVGIKKFAYDIWGDTVNIAARMEQNSEAGRINISGATYELVKDKFKCEHRGKISAKHKGEIDMYFVQP